MGKSKYEKLFREGEAVCGEPFAEYLDFLRAYFGSTKWAIQKSNMNFLFAQKQ